MATVLPLAAAGLFGLTWVCWLWWAWSIGGWDSVVWAAIILPVLLAALLATTERLALGWRAATGLVTGRRSKAHAMNDFREDTLDALVDALAPGIERVSGSRKGRPVSPEVVGVLVAIPVWIMGLIALVDVMRRRDLGTGRKVAWAALLFVFTPVTLIYLLARPVGDVGTVESHDLPASDRRRRFTEAIEHDDSRHGSRLAGPNGACPGCGPAPPRRDEASSGTGPDIDPDHEIVRRRRSRRTRLPGSRRPTTGAEDLRCASD